MNPYSYPQDTPHTNIYLKQTAKHWLHYLVDFPSAYPTQHEKNNTVRGEYFQPRDLDNAALAILLHGIGDYSITPCKLLAQALAREGIASFVLYLIMHSSRMTESARKRFPHLTTKEWFENHQISVINLRQVIDWASNRTEINSRKITTVGISFGGFVSAIAMGIDEEVVRRAARLVDGSEYKRRQAPPGVKITLRAFGRDRRLPITNRFKG